jgi:hypothetical protein
MADRRRGFGRWRNKKPNTVEVLRTDRFIDALAAGQPAESDDPDDRALGALLEDWRDELRSAPADELATEAAAAGALGVGPIGRARRTHRAHRGLTMIGSAAAAVLTLGGLGAVVLGSQPGDALYGLRSTLFGEPKSVVDDRIELTAKTEMGKVQEMIAQGQWDQAQERLASLGDTVQTVNDTQRRQNLVDQWNRLNVQVQKRGRNPAPPASTPPASQPEEYVPEEPATPAPSSSETPGPSTSTVGEPPMTTVQQAEPPPGQ